MVTREENELLTRVEGDAPMGALMREHYWIPAALPPSSSPTGHPSGSGSSGGTTSHSVPPMGGSASSTRRVPHRGTSLVLAAQRGVRAALHLPRLEDRRGRLRRRRAHPQPQPGSIRRQGSRRPLSRPRGRRHRLGLARVDARSGLPGAALHGAAREPGLDDPHDGPTATGCRAWRRRSTAPTSAPCTTPTSPGTDPGKAPTSPTRSRRWRPGTTSSARPTGSMRPPSGRWPTAAPTCAPPTWFAAVHQPGPRIGRGRHLRAIFITSPIDDTHHNLFYGICSATRTSTTE